MEQTTVNSLKTELGVTERNLKATPDPGAKHILSRKLEQMTKRLQESERVLARCRSSR